MLDDGGFKITVYKVQVYVRFLVWKKSTYVMKL